jgi:hypothetical protein
MQDERFTRRSRRAFLATVSLGLVAGCTSAEETPPGIGELAVSNRGETAVTATFTFEQDGNQRQSSVDVPAAGEGGFEGKTVVEDWMGEHGSWELTVETDGVSGRYSSSDFDQQFYDYDQTDCLLLDVRIETDSIDIIPRTVAVDCP